MKKRGIEKEITNFVKEFLEITKNKDIHIVSHFDTDGITSAAIIIQTLKKLDKRFTLQIIKRIEDDFIEKLPKNKPILFLDLASGHLKEIEEANLKEIFIIDHHEISNPKKIPKKINMINPEISDNQKISASGLCYLFAKEINTSNKKLAKLAVLGMIGDCLDKEVGKLNHDILKDGEVEKKRGLLIYPATRPLNRTLEYSSSPYIPGVTGNKEGVLELLREAELTPTKKGYPSLIELNEEEMANLVTGIMLKNPKAKNKEIIGDIFLIKLYNKLEDARELSAKINACSRSGRSDIAIQLCMEVQKIKDKAESIHIKYKQNIVSGLKIVSKRKVKGKGFVIINAKDKISDSIIGTVTSIVSNSLLYNEGTIVIGMAYYKKKIKISARIVGKDGRNVREVLSNIVEKTGGNAGGHAFAAGCTIHQDKEEEFIKHLKKDLKVELVKI